MLKDKTVCYKTVNIISPKQEKSHKFQWIINPYLIKLQSTQEFHENSTTYDIGKSEEIITCTTALSLRFTQKKN